jgi:hypothetical protein
MKSLMIVSNDVSRDARVQREGRSLVRAGHEVEVIGWDRRGTESKSDNIGGVKVTRMKNTRLMRVAPGDLFRNPLWWRMAYKEGLNHEFDIVHCHDLDTLPIWCEAQEEERDPSDIRCARDIHLHD